VVSDCAESALDEMENAVQSKSYGKHGARRKRLFSTRNSPFSEANVSRVVRANLANN
jgi:hypothetical protein